MTKTHKNIILSVLLIVPLVFYILLSFGINNFARLPILTKNVIDIANTDTTKTVQFKNHISVVCFLGSDVQNVKVSVFNLNQKIYKRFYGYKNFQIVGVYLKGSPFDVTELKKGLARFSNIDMSKWKFVPADKNQIEAIYKSFKTGENLSENLQSSKAFLIDKTLNLRGRLDDKDSADGKLTGYDTESVACLSNKMIDDIKVVLAEYRLALKNKKSKRKT